MGETTLLLKWELQGGANLVPRARLQEVSTETVEQIARQARVTPTYLVLMACSGVLAAVAFLADSVPLLVGSMVVAPALPPLALVAFAVVGRRIGYVGKGLSAAALGILLAALCSVVAAWLLNITGVFPPESNLVNKALLEERVNPGWFSAVAAVAAGIAGTLALANNRSDTLVGAVAALALVPTAAAAGISLLSGDPVASFGAAGLLAINVFVIVLAGIVTLSLVKLDDAEH